MSLLQSAIIVRPINHTDVSFPGPAPAHCAVEAPHCYTSYLVYYYSLVGSVPFQRASAKVSIYHPHNMKLTTLPCTAVVVGGESSLGRTHLDYTVLPSIIIFVANRPLNV